MKLLVFAVRDRAVDAFMTPMFLQAVGQAVRMFSDEVNRDAADNVMFKHPDDYDLYQLGVYDGDTGLFETGVPEQICIGKTVSLSYVERKQPIRAVQ